MVISANINPKGAGAYEYNRILSKKGTASLCSLAEGEISSLAIQNPLRFFARVSKEAKSGSCDIAKFVSRLTENKQTKKTALRYFLKEQSNTSFPTKGSQEKKGTFEE